MKGVMIELKFDSIKTKLEEWAPCRVDNRVKVCRLSTLLVTVFLSFFLFMCLLTSYYVMKIQVRSIGIFDNIVDT